MNRVRYLLRNAGILAISNFASKILVFLLVPLYTSVLTTTEYGIYDLIISTVAVLLPILTCNISDAVMRFSMDNNYPKEQVLKVGFLHTIIGVCFSWLIILLLHISGIISAFRELEFITGIYFLFYAFNQFFIQAAKGNEKVTDMGIAAVLGTIVMIVANLLFLLVFKYGLKGFFIANILAQAIPALYLLVRLQVMNNVGKLFHHSNSLHAEMLMYCVPLIATVIGWWVNSASDRYVVALMCGVSANGLLSVSYKIPAIVNTFQAIFTQAWQISAIKEYETNDKSSFYGKTFLLVNIVLCCICSIMIVLTKPVARFLYSKDFYDAWKYVPFLLVSCVLNSSSGILGPILSAKKDSKSLALSAIFGAISNIILNIVLVSLIGIQGACIATVAASYVIYHVRRRAVGKDIVIKDYNVVVATWILLCVQSFVEIYSSLWVLEVIIFALIQIINIKNIRSLMGVLIARKIP